MLSQLLPRTAALLLTLLVFSCGESGSDGGTGGSGATSDAGGSSSGGTGQAGGGQGGGGDAGGGGSFAAEPGFSVSGTFAADQSITITKSGGGFGTKPNDPKPLLWIPFTTSATPSALGRLSSYAETSEFTFQPTDGADGNGRFASAPANGTDTNEWTMRIDSDQSGATGTDFNAYGSKLYINKRAKKNFGHLDGSTNRNIKNFRMWGRSDGGAIQSPNFYFGLSLGRFNVEGLTDPPASAISDYTMDATTLADADGINGAWYQEEMLLKANTDGASQDADFRWLVNAGAPLVQFPNFTYQDNYLMTKQDSGYEHDGRMRVMYPVHYLVEGSDGWTPASAGSIYEVDDVYVDDSWAAVIVCDSSTYTDCTYHEPQPPSAWADASITVTLQAGAMATFSGKHMFVRLDDASTLHVGQFP